MGGKALPGHPLPQLGEVGGDLVGIGDAAVGGPAARCPHRSGEGCPLRRIDDDPGTPSLKLQRRGQAQGTTADDGDGRRASHFPGQGHGLVSGDGAGSPGQRPAAATVAVVVDDFRVADPLDIQARASGAERTRADGDPNDPLRRHLDWGEPAWCEASGRRPGRRPRRSRAARHAADQSEPAQTGQYRATGVQGRAGHRHLEIVRCQPIFPIMQTPCLVLRKHRAAV